MATTEKPYRITHTGNTLLVEALSSKTEDASDATQYEKDISAAIAALNPAVTEFKFDFTKFTVFVGDTEMQIRYFLNQFKNVGFKKIVFMTGTSTILKMQSNRIAKELGMDNFEAV